MLSKNDVTNINPHKPVSAKYVKRYVCAYAFAIVLPYSTNLPLLKPIPNKKSIGGAVVIKVLNVLKAPILV